MDIFVGSLPFKSTEKQVKELFEAYGSVNAVSIVIDKITRQNKGFGFVTMPVDAEAHNAIKALNNSVFMDRTIVVQLSENKLDKSKPSKRPSNGGQKTIAELYADMKAGKKKKWNYGPKVVDYRKK
jgi:RNA recognition motif-containing protein